MSTLSTLSAKASATGAVYFSICPVTVDQKPTKITNVFFFMSDQILIPKTRLECLIWVRLDQTKLLQKSTKEIRHATVGGACADEAGLFSQNNKTSTEPVQYQYSSVNSLQRNPVSSQLKLNTI